MSEKVSVRAHAVILNGEVSRKCIVSYTPDDPVAAPEIRPFNGEIHSTTSFNGIIAFAPAGFTLPSGLTPPADLSVPGSFSSYLSRLAEAIPHCTGCPSIPLFIQF